MVELKPVSVFEVEKAEITAKDLEVRIRNHQTITYYRATLSIHTDNADIYISNGVVELKRKARIEVYDDPIVGSVMKYVRVTTEKEGKT